MASNVSLDDLNLVIKNYAHQVWRRIEQLDRRNIGEIEKEKNDEEIDRIVKMYENYTLDGERELEYGRRMVQKLIQIFSFFKWKSRHYHLLHNIQESIKIKLNEFINRRELGEALAFVVQVGEKGAVIKRPPNSYSRPKIPPKDTSINKSTSVKRKTASVMSSFKTEVFTKQDPQPKLPKMIQVIHSLYGNILNLDRQHILRSLNNPEIAKKEAQRRNEQIYLRIKVVNPRMNHRSHSKMKTQILQTPTKNILLDMCNRVFTKKEKPQPMMFLHSWTTKKRKIKTASRKAHPPNQNFHNFK